VGADEIPSVGRFEDAHGQLAKSGQTLAFVAVPDGVRPAPPVDAVPQAPRSGGKFTPESGQVAGPQAP
jgi:hypothetical protein